MLSKFIDNVYYNIRYAIWGPAIEWNDGTITPEGRENHERIPIRDLASDLDTHEVEWQDTHTWEGTN